MRLNSFTHTGAFDCCQHPNCAEECVCDSDFCYICDTAHDCVCDEMADAYRERDLDF